MIGTAKKLDLNNFRLGQRRDSALRDDAMLSLRTLKNMDIIYSDGRLRVRKGYERWNATALPAKATQLYHFVDLEGNEYLLGILDTSTLDGFDKWYIIKESGDHVILQNNGATARRPVITYGNRCFFATNAELRWTDSDAIATGATKSFQTGIGKPQYSPTIEVGISEGNVVGVGVAIPGGLELNATGRKKFAAKFSLSSAATVWSIPVRWTPFFAAAAAGAFRVSLHVDDEGDPGDRVDDDAITPWLSICSGADGVAQETDMAFGDGIELEPATDYWIVVSASDEYMANYRGTLPYFLVTFPYSAHAALDWNGSAWLASNKKLGFTVGGVSDDDDTYYDYVVTHYASNYNVESRPSDRSDRVVRASWTYNRFIVSFTQPSGHPQIDQVRIYRREVGTDPSIADADVVDEYKLVDSVAEDAGSYSDLVASGNLGGILQSEDHYRLADTVEGDDSLRPSAIVPNVATVWKGRIWVAQENENILHFSKVLEETGATGLIQDNVPDFFPLENRLELPEASGVVAAEPLPDDSLAVYFENETVWCVWGGDDVRNPPADFSYRRILPNKGLYAPAAIDHESTGHVILGRHGLYRFSGLGVMEYLSETNQTILDDIENAYLLGSRIVVNGNEIWMLVDTDNDGSLETIMILDLQRDLPTRQLRDRAWRMYEYDVSLNDLVVRKAGGEFRNILAADAENNYILSLNTGDLDYIYPIDTEMETQDLQAEGLVGISALSLRARYVDSAVSYKVAITDGDGVEHDFSLSPGSQGDLRGHRTECRILAPNFVRVKIESSHVKQDEIRGITIDYIAEG